MGRLTSAAVAAALAVATLGTLPQRPDPCAGARRRRWVDEDPLVRLATPSTHQAVGAVLRARMITAETCRTPRLISAVSPREPEGPTSQSVVRKRRSR